jgi:hypothetical protein
MPGHRWAAFRRLSTGREREAFFCGNVGVPRTEGRRRTTLLDSR